jgi:pimeloyl-ACP methyl ester carboxylesterase
MHSRTTILTTVAVLFVSGCVSVPEAPPAPAPVAAAPSMNLAVGPQEVCFQGHNPRFDGQTTFDLRGTWFRPPTAAAATAIILTHGASWPRQSYDASEFAQDIDQTSFPRLLAKAGYAVFTWDRLGYGQSKYTPVSGMELTYGGDVDRLHEIVQQVRSGSFRDETCDAKHKEATGFENVVVAGLSGGGFTTMGYAVRYHDVEAAIPMGFPFGGPSVDFWARRAVECAPPHPQAPMGYAYLFCQGPNGVSTMCMDLLFHAPGIRDADAIRVICRNENIGVEPVGNLDVSLLAEIEARVGEVTTPTLLVFAEFDGAVNTGPNYDGRMPQERTIRQWEMLSQSTLDVIQLPATGHALTMHESRFSLVEQIDGWLTAQSLGARSG